MPEKESVVENETHTILWDFQIQTCLLIPVKRPDVVFDQQERNLSSIEFCRFGGSQSKTKRKRKDFF